MLSLLIASLIAAEQLSLPAAITITSAAVGACRGVVRWNVPDAKYEQVSTAKANLPRTKAFQGLTPETLQQQVPIWVISLARATARRKSITQNLAAAGITNFELIDAADYHNASSVTKADLHK